VLTLTIWETGSDTLFAPVSTLQTLALNCLWALAAP